MGDFYSVREVAEMIGVNTRTVLKWINDGKINAYKFGDLWKIKKTDYEEFLQQASNRPKEK